MDFDIGNILYLVITLVVVIVGLLGRKKKPSTTASESGEGGSKSQPGFLENLENVLRMGQEEPGVVDLQAYEEDLPGEEVSQEPVDSDHATFAQDSSPTPGGIMAEYERMMEMQGASEHDIILADADSVTEPLEVIDLEAEQGTDYFEIVKDFDAGTAVVYSAIINRIDY